MFFLEKYQILFNSFKQIKHTTILTQVEPLNFKTLNFPASREQEILRNSFSSFGA